jgi:hypothetical protein
VRAGDGEDDTAVDQCAERLRPLQHRNAALTRRHHFGVRRRNGGCHDEGHGFAHMLRIVTALDVHPLLAQAIAGRARAQITPRHAAAAVREQLRQRRHARTGHTHEVHRSAQRERPQVDAHPHVVRRAAHAIRR